MTGDTCLSAGWMPSPCLFCVLSVAAIVAVDVDGC